MCTMIHIPVWMSIHWMLPISVSRTSKKNSKKHHGETKKSMIAKLDDVLDSRLNAYRAYCEKAYSRKVNEGSSRTVLKSIPSTSVSISATGKPDRETNVRYKSTSSALVFEACWPADVSALVGSRISKGTCVAKSKLVCFAYSVCSPNCFGEKRCIIVEKEGMRFQFIRRREHSSWILQWRYNN